MASGGKDISQPPSVSPSLTFAVDSVGVAAAQPLIVLTSWVSRLGYY
jgi:hypothetical protein